MGRWRATTNVRDVLQEVRDALLASHPGTPAAAETYTGLRQQISAAVTHRRRHLVHLARLSAATHTHPTSLPQLLHEMREEENLTEAWDGPPEWFTRESAPTPEHSLHVLTPAYITHTDNHDTVLIRQGTGEWRRA